MKEQLESIGPLRQIALNAGALARLLWRRKFGSALFVGRGLVRGAYGFLTSFLHS